MSTIGNLVVALTAKTEQFERGMSQATGLTAKFEQANNALMKKMLGVGAAISFLRRASSELGDVFKKLTEGSITGDEAWLQTLQGVGRAIPVIGDAAVSAASAIHNLSVGLAELSRQAAQVEAMRFQDQLQAFNNRLIAMRQQAEGMNPILIEARILGVKNLEVVKEQLKEINRLQMLNKFRDMVNDIMAQRIEMLHGAEAALRYRLALQGLSDSQINFIASMQRANDEIRKQQEELRRAEAERKSLEDEAKQIIRSIMTPMERYQETLERLQKLLDEGLLTQEQYARAVAKAREELERMSEVQAELREQEARGLPGLVERRFTADVPALRTGSGTSGMEKKLADVLTEDKKQNKWLENILFELRDSQDVQPVIIDF